MEAFQNISLFTLDSTMKEMNESKAHKKDKANQIFGGDMVKMSQIHIKLMSLTFSMIRMATAKCPKFKQHLANMANILCLTYIQEYATVGFESGYFAKGHIRMMDQAIKNLLQKVRPQLIPMIEVGNEVYSDNTLCSAIGNSYGDIYETHLEWAKDSRLNHTKGGIQKGWEEHIMPILRGKM